MDAAQKVDTPTLKELEDISRDRRLCCSSDELKSFQDIIAGTVDRYNFVKDYKFPENISKYGGDRKFYKPEENIHNAWYVKCHMQGNTQGKLLNKKVAIKDNTAVARIPMMNGSMIVKGYTPEYDATVVQRILEHGGSIIGKTTCEDMCLSGGSFLTHLGPVMNPLNKEYSAGGSSSGSGVVVATGEADMAIGGDQGGSVRIPASSCGIVGLKPTHGLVPYTGAIPITPCLDHLGPMAKNVADCALLLECIAGYDNGFDYRQSPHYNVPVYSELIYPLVVPVKRLKIGILKEGVEMCDGNVKRVFHKAVDQLRSNKLLEIAEVSYPNHAHAVKFYVPILSSGLYGSMIQGCGYGTSIKGVQSHSLAHKLQTGYKDHAGRATPNVKMLTMVGEYIHQKHGSFHYAKASSIISHMNLQYNRLLNEFDVVIMPTLTKTPAKIPTTEVDIKDQIERAFNMLENTGIFNATGHPALSLNCGFDGDLPVGLQIIGRHFDEVQVLNVASIFEESFKNITTQK